MKLPGLPDRHAGRTKVDPFALEFAVAQAHWLTQVNAIQVGASLLGHVHVHIEEDHWVPKVLPGAGIQHQHSIMGRGAGERLVVPVWPFGAVQRLADAETATRFGARCPGRGVRQDGHDFVWITWKVSGHTEMPDKPPMYGIRFHLKGGFNL